MFRLVAFACLVGGCVESASVKCGALLCSNSSVCSPAGDRCVLASQIDACAGKADRDACSYVGVSDGVCSAQVCMPAGCGNGVVEADAGELCDDANRVSFDGCSADCTSDERCGNGVTDFALGETCDCGDGAVAVTGCAMANSDAPGAQCRANCTPAGCGDGILDPGEICDDGNTTPGDGCRSDCQGRWTVMYSGTYALLQGVWGTSRSDVFAVGDATILHYNGTAWLPMTVPDVRVIYSAVWGSGPADVYAVGTLGSTGIVDHYDGSSWSNLATLPSTRVSGVAGTSASDVWVVGEASGGAYIHHTTGATGAWTFVDVPTASANWVHVWTDGTNVWATDSSYGLWTTPAGAVNWTQVPGVAAGALWGVGPNDAYAMKDQLVHFDGAGWTDVPGALAAQTSAFAMGGVSGDLLIVNQREQLLRFDGSALTVSPKPSSLGALAVWGYQVNHAYVVGDTGLIMY